MPALLDATENAVASEGKRIPPQLAAFVFQKGNPPPKGAGRPKGSRSASTIYLESLPKKAQQWVKSTAPAVLIDARKIALPIESDQAGSDAGVAVLLGWMEARLLGQQGVQNQQTNLMNLQMPLLPVAADGTASRMGQIPQVMVPDSSTVNATGIPSAGTESAQAGLSVPETLAQGATPPAGPSA